VGSSRAAADLATSWKSRGKVVGPLVSSDMQDVAKAARRQHADFGAIVFDRDVGGERRAMHDHRDIGRLDARLLANLQHAAQHAHRLVMWRARNLVDENLCTIILVHLLEDQIGEGSADVDSYSCHGHFLFEP
jgi:hypothetical protein